MSYVSEQLEKLVQLNSSEPEFIQAATEVLQSLEPVIEQNPAYEKDRQYWNAWLNRSVRSNSAWLGWMTTARCR